MYVTNRPDVAEVAQSSGVDWIFVDLEILGKEDRQGHLDTVISGHTIEDVRELRKVVKDSKLLVRVNPVHSGSAEEIDGVVAAGADIIMLPYFHSASEVRDFVRLVGGRTQTCILIETPDSVAEIDGILGVEGIDCVHIGLNDLHLGYDQDFMFELLVDGTVDYLADKIAKAGIPFGFGGIARLGGGALQAEMILAEHSRVGSSQVILSRAFCHPEQYHDTEHIERIFAEEVGRIRDFQKWLDSAPEDFFERNKEKVRLAVEDIVGGKIEPRTFANELASYLVMDR